MDDHLSNEDYAKVREVARDPRRTTRSSFAAAQQAHNERQSRAFDEAERTLGYAGDAALNRTRPTSTLEEITDRIYAACSRLCAVTDLLTDHADRLHSCEDEAVDRAGVEETPPGQISRIFQALEHLDRVVERNAYAAGRNTNIA